MLPSLAVMNYKFIINQLITHDHSCLCEIQNKPFKIIRVPTRTGKPGKPGKMGRHFPVREKSGNFEQTGKVRENHTKYWKTEIN